jgi:hypothetical protein
LEAAKYKGIKERIPSTTGKVAATTSIVLVLGLPNPTIKAAKMPEYHKAEASLYQNQMES